MTSRTRAGLLAIGVLGWWALWGMGPAWAQGGSNANDAIQPKLDQRHLWNFDGEKPGEAPGGFSAGTMGEGPPGKWSVEPDAQAPTAPHRLTQGQLNSNADSLQILLADGIIYDYVDLSVRLRLAGDGSQAAGGGGVIFRAKDARNFYAVIADVAANSLDVIRVMDGQVSVLTHEPIKPKSGPWHLLRVLHNTILSKDLIEVAFDGKIVYSIWDKDQFGGQIGLVTRGASAVGFDNFHAIQLYSQKPLSKPAAY
ncbi:MAG: hypothetical protein ACKOCD_02770 [Nitrospiraceae bacterium]